MFVIVVLLSVITATVGMLMPLVEANDPKANIRTLYDGIWWATSTITSVGYGDHYPITFAGRVLGFFLIVFGSTTFFAFTSLLAAMLLLRETKKDHNEIMSRLRELEEKIDRKS